jgi:hypothetical protein
LSGGSAQLAAAQCPGTPPATSAGRFDLGTIPSGVQTDLRLAPTTSLLFERKNLLANMDYSYGIAVGDFDCDSKWDVSMFDSWGGRRMRPQGAIGYVSYGGNAATQITTLDKWPELAQPVDMSFLLERHIALDVNGDQLPDIVGVANSHAAVVAYINPGNPFGMWARRYLNTGVPAPISLVAHDIDGDGLQDIVVSMRKQPSSDPNPAVRGLVWLKNPGPVVEGAWARSSIGPSDHLLDPRNLQVADFDRNGKPDVFVADSSTGIVSTFLQGVNGDWEAYNNYVTAIHGHFGAMVDEDVDGVPEIIQPTYLSLSLLRFDAAQKTWARRTLISFANEEKLIVPSDVIVADIDADGFSDIIFSIAGLSTSGTDPRRGGIYVMRHAKTWKVETLVRTTHSVVELKAIDLNRDGLIDVVSDAEYPLHAVMAYYQKRLPGWWGS